MNPLVSVIIPAFNQARYLGAALHSVLEQSYRPLEVIVVDDGSTDNTAAVASAFGSAITLVHQENRGLAGARNTGIRQAHGEYVALLDADDLWEPGYLAAMTRLAALHPDAAVCYCGYRYVDADGHGLPQEACTRVVAPRAMYDTLLRANFLAVSATLIRREPLVAAGLFDGDKRLRGLEDYDLWLRLLRQGHEFVGSPACLMSYRQHESSLSVSHREMGQALAAVVAKHFGPADGCPAQWTPAKRRAYGGAYRYAALTSLYRAADWETCARHLRMALVADPTLATDLDLFFELVLGTQPQGYRGTPQRLDMEASVRGTHALLDTLFAQPPDPALAGASRHVRGTAYYALGMASRIAGSPSLTRHFLTRAATYRPALLRDGTFTRRLVSSLLPRRARVTRGRGTALGQAGRP